MSRTKRGSKPPGYEYWSRRPGNKHGGVAGKIGKVITKKRERAAEKSEIYKSKQDSI